MKTFRNISLIFAVLMILSFAVSMVAVPNASAQTNNVVTWPFVDAIPKIAGVGQPVLINWGLINYLTIDTDGWNVTLQITDPNGKVTNTTAKTWSTGTVGRKMPFMEPGNYTLQTFFDGETYNGRYYAPSESEPMTLQILEGYWKVDYPGHTLPDEYWTRPVDSQLREWWSIMGSWVTRPPNWYAPWNEAPESAHILWSMPIGDSMGGLSGGDTGNIGFTTGDAYEGKFGSSVILAGVLYYNKYATYTASSISPQQEVVAVDLHTGKILWERSYGPDMGMGTGRISRGQMLLYMTENNRGAWAYLWIVDGTNMFALDALTGDPKFNMTNVPSGTIYIGPNGEMLKYRAINYGTTDNPSWYLQQWNSTYVVNNGTRLGTADSWGPNVQGRSYDATQLGFDVNVSLSGVRFIPGQSTPTVQNPVQTAAPITVFPCDRAIFGNVSIRGVTLSGISIDSENFGSNVFSPRTWDAPADWADISSPRLATFSDDPYVAVCGTKESRINYAFSLETGRFLWQSEPHGHADAWSSSGLQGAIVDGKLYQASISGVVYCYDAATGEVLWTYEATDKYNESYHSENWWLMLLFISDGKAYFGHQVHSNTVPISRGAPFFALDAETGELIWEIDGAFRQTHWGGAALMGDSIIATMDTYDQQIYAIGKGPSEMTVSAPNVGVTTGTAALISGTVMDISPGTQQDNLQMRFSKGVPAVSDECMSEWMLYVYKQFERPMDTVGVEVTVFAQQGDDVIDIGTTISDDNGRFAIAWTPNADGTGTWDIYAYFSGSASYYGSYAKTEMVVSAAPVIVEPEPIPYIWYIIGTGIAIIASVAIVGLLIIRKIGSQR